MNCDYFRERIQDHLDAQLGEDQDRLWREHYLACGECRCMADSERSAHQAIAAAARRYAAGILPPAQGREAVRRHLTWRRRRWMVAAVAALLLAGVALALMASHGPLARRGGEGSSELARRHAELVQLKTWQDELGRSCASQDSPESDRLWRLVADAYLPPAYQGCVLPPGEDEPRQVVGWQHSTRRGGSTIEVVFRQYDDGTVHLERSRSDGQGEVRTVLDAASWDRLLASQPPPEPGREGADEEGWRQVGLPLPARGRLIRDACSARQGSGGITDLARRLALLRLATRIRSRDELAVAMQGIDTQQTDPAARAAAEPGPGLEDAVLRLEALTGFHRFPPGEWRTAMRCLSSGRRPAEGTAPAPPARSDVIQ